MPDVLWLNVPRGDLRVFSNARQKPDGSWVDSRGFKIYKVYTSKSEAINYVYSKFNEYKVQKQVQLMTACMDLIMTLIKMNFKE